MTIDFLHLYCKCPHCTTMFRASVSEIDASEGWVKCGHCRKVFDCRENEVKPADFIMPDQEIEQQVATKTSGPAATAQTTITDDDEYVPQIPLFDEPESVEKPVVASSIEVVEDHSGDSPLPSHVQDTSAEPVEHEDHQLAPVKKESDQSVIDGNPRLSNLNIDTNHVRNPGMQNNKLQSYRNHVDAVATGQGKSKNRHRYPSILKNRLNIAKPQAPRFSRVILSKAQSWKKRKNRSRKSGVVTYALVSVALFTLFVWQISVVNYNKLSQYGFLSAPLAAVCSIVTCNQTAQPKGRGFEILHASIRRHASTPNVMTVSAKLINFGDENKLIPSIRLDLTSDKNTVIASRIIDLVENPQYVDPALTELAPGQDVKLSFNIENPAKQAHGFQLNFVASQ